MEKKLFDCSKTSARVGIDFTKAILQPVLQEYEDKNLESYPTRTFKIATDILYIKESRKTRLHICSFHFLTMNRESIQNLFGKKDDADKDNFCMRIIGRLICCQSLDEAIEICKLAAIVLKNKKVTTVVEKSVQELEKTVNCFDMLPQVKKYPGYRTTDEDDQEEIIEATSRWKHLWDKELANCVAKKGMQ